MRRTLTVGLGLCGLAVIGAAAMAWRFDRRLDAYAAALRVHPVGGPRADLPPQVVALATRLGVDSARGERFHAV